MYRVRYGKRARSFHLLSRPFLEHLHVFSNTALKPYSFGLLWKPHYKVTIKPLVSGDWLSLQALFPHWKSGSGTESSNPLITCFPWQPIPILTCSPKCHLTNIRKDPFMGLYHLEISTGFKRSVPEMRRKPNINFLL